MNNAIKLISALAVVVAAMLLSTATAMAADWPNSRDDAGNTGNSPETLSLPLTEAWHSSAPVVEENGAVVSNGIAYMASENSQLYAFDVATGSIVPGFPVSTAFSYSAPAVDAVNEKVYVLASSTLFAFNLDGTPAWTASVGTTGNNYNVGPVVDGGFVYLKAGGTLKKYDSTGALQWSVASSGINTQPAVSGGFVYVNTEGGQIRKYDKTTGTEVTSGGFPITTIGSQAGLAVADGKIFHKADQLYAYDASTGALAWSAADGGDSTYYDSPAVSNGVVYVYGWDAKLYAFDETTGATMAGFPSVALSTPSDRNWSSPSVAGDKVFVGAGTSQKLKVLGAAGSANAGVVLEEHSTFSADPQGFDLCSPIVSDGVVFAMLDGGGLYAFFTGGGGGTGSIVINGGDDCTESRDVTLTIDPDSYTEMRISEDPLFTGASFEPVATTKAFTLSAGYGTKTVYIQFRDSSGNLSNVFNDSIEYAADCNGGGGDITAQGTTVNTTEGASFSGTVATFEDPGNPQGTASDYSATIDWGDGTSSSAGTISGTGGNFTVDGTHTYTEEGTYDITVVITDVNDSSRTATAHSTANVEDAPLHSKCAAPRSSPQAFSGTTATFTDENSYADSSDFSATIDWGDSSSSSGTVSSGTGSGPYTVTGTHAYTSTGTYTITTTINDVGGSKTVARCKVLVFSFAPGGGAFVIGNKNHATGTHVYFWGAQWWMRNTLSGGLAPSGFKGWAKYPAQPTCGTNWSTDPGNSAPPPNGPLPAHIGVIVAKHTAKSGSQISGDTVHISVVKTDPGYAPQPAPGHPGTGTVEAQVC
jgi:outer membrane protein assembly factor BamB